MKKALYMIQLLSALSTIPAAAWKSNSPTQKEYTFKYQLKAEIIRLSIEANTYEDAFEKAASQCAKHFKGSQKLTEDAKLDIIDVCANPRS